MSVCHTQSREIQPVWRPLCKIRTSAQAQGCVGQWPCATGLVRAAPNHSRLSDLRVIRIRFFITVLDPASTSLWSTRTKVRLRRDEVAIAFRYQAPTDHLRLLGGSRPRPPGVPGLALSTGPQPAREKWVSIPHKVAISRRFCGLCAAYGRPPRLKGAWGSGPVQRFAPEPRTTTLDCPISELFEFPLHYSPGSI